MCLRNQKPAHMKCEAAWERDLIRVSLEVTTGGQIIQSVSGQLSENSMGVYLKEYTDEIGIYIR